MYEFSYIKRLVHLKATYIIIYQVKITGTGELKQHGTQERHDLLAFFPCPCLALNVSSRNHFLNGPTLQQLIKVSDDFLPPMKFFPWRHRRWPPLTSFVVCLNGNDGGVSGSRGRSCQSRRVGSAQRGASCLRFAIVVKTNQV